MKKKLQVTVFFVIMCMALSAQTAIPPPTAVGITYSYPLTSLNHFLISENGFLLNSLNPEPVSKYQADLKTGRLQYCAAGSTATDFEYIHHGAITQDRTLWGWEEMEYITLQEAADDSRYSDTCGMYSGDERKNSELTTFAGGNGTESDPWQIATPEHLNNVRNFIGAGNHFIQIANIDLGIAPWNQNQGWAPIGVVTGDFFGYDQSEAFNGVFNGNGYIISNIYISNWDYPAQNGLFAFLGLSAVVKNVTLANVTLEGFAPLGSLAAYNDGVIEYCQADGLLFGGQSNTGGLVGANNGTISTSKTNCIIGGGTNVGGLVGWNFTDAMLVDACTDSQVSGANICGGIVGWNDGTIERCYTSSTAAIDYPGGFVGPICSGFGGGTKLNTYWHVNAYGLTEPSGNDGKTTAQMKQQATFVGWNFNTVWSIIENQSFPFLTPQIIELPAPVLSSPANYSSNISLNPTLQWQAVENAQTYGIQVSTAANFSVLIVNENGLSTTSYALSNLSTATQYYWRVNATGGTITGDWSEVWSFTTLPGQQSINLNQGWTGISSYLDPANPVVADLMSAIEEQLIILRDFDGNYYQPTSKNTLINWDANQGYFIKMASGGDLVIEGFYPLSRQFDLQTGWNLIPVLSDVPVLIEDYLFDHLDKVEIVTEVAGINVFWQEMNINTLEMLIPGKAYLVKALAPFSLFQLPEVVTSVVTDITANTATCGGEVLNEGSSSVIERGVVWSTSENPTIEDNEGIVYNGTGLGSWLSELTGLDPQTNYFVRAFAHNHVGTAYGEQISFITQQQGSFTCGISTITDIDGNLYNTVLVGDQCWMKENLKTTRDAGGNSITRDCYNNVTNNCNLYGGLYTWTTMMNGAASSNTNPSGVQGICPTGWHLPSNVEWSQLVDYVVSQGYPNDMFNANGAGNALKSCRQFNSPLGGNCNTSDHPRWNSNESHYGFDEFNFSGLPAGKSGLDGIFTTLGQWSYWWSTLDDFTTNAWGKTLNWGSGSLGGTSTNKGSGFSVRCLKNEGTGPTTYNLNLEVNPSGAGVVNGAGQYEAGEQVNIAAEANLGWDFVNWTDEDGTEVSALPSFSYTMPAEDLTLTANFEEETAGFTCGEPLIDARDGQEYETVQIGNQCWMAENLKYLPAVVGPGTGSNTAPHYYVYGYNGTNLSAAKATVNYQNYGALYNWPASLTACPTGWHLPSDAEWTLLTNYLIAQGFPNSNVTNGESNALKSCRQVSSPLGGNCNTGEHPRWNSHSTHHGFDEFGFSALPGGNRWTNVGFATIGSNGYWWNSTEWSLTDAWFRRMNYGFGNSERTSRAKSDGLSIRCLKD
jgi:uncharacterized protein (TIGR02145 family)/uncharacterized repeat protein (TIGR02543 family)